MQLRARTGLKWIGAGAVLAALVIQAVPYGRAHGNPPVIAEPSWDSARARELAVRACYACHSNETAWPWYSNVAPFSWWIQGHVNEGREELNFSEWGRSRGEGDEVAESVTEGEMPPGYYTFFNRGGRLSALEREELIRGLRATFPAGAGGGDEGGEDEPAERDDDDD